jgi:hypothetical protein
VTNSSWLDDKYRSLVPSEAEMARVSDAIGRVEKALENRGGPWRIAERYPCGSFAKGTMLAGRSEADLVIVLREAVDAASLDRLAGVLHEDLGALLARRPVAKTKAVGVTFKNGVQVDVLPVWSKGLSEPVADVPEKLKVGLNGRFHVRWFTTEAHGTPVHPTVRLVKHFRDCHPELRPLSSFAIEVLAVWELEDFWGNLADHFEGLLGTIARGDLEAPLLDPADHSNDLLARVTTQQRTGIARVATRAVADIASRTWSQVFPTGPRPPRPGTNIGGQTLA